MKLLATTAVAILATLCGSLNGADAHSFLAKPTARASGAYHSDPTGSMGCPTNGAGPSTSYKPGETIDVRYWRNNHIGGFIRWSISPRGKESKEDFDQGDFFYTCRESGPDCLPKGGELSNPMISDGAGDTPNTVSCGDKITMPDWLPAGDYVLQWTWFGVGHSFGNPGWAEPQFRSCADIKLTADGPKQKKPACPRFIGGDRMTKAHGKGDKQCFYFHTTEIVSSIFKTDNGGAQEHYKYGVPAYVEKCQGGGGDDDAGKDDDATRPPRPTNTTAPGTTSPAPSPTNTNAPGTTSPAPSPSPTKKPTCTRKPRM